jgi:hypothetical protein
MKAFLVLALGAIGVGACGGPPGGGDDQGPYCTTDSQCPSGDICAHDDECLPPDQVHAVVIHWTISGQPPNTTTCAGIAQLDVGYLVSQNPNEGDIFSPVSCTEAAFPNDKWPIRFDTASVQADSANGSTTGLANIPPDPSVDVTVDVAHP